MKKAKIKDLANFLGVSESAVKQYDKRKKLLMLLGLYVYQQNTKHQFKDERLKKCLNSIT